jgi:hypothetical protein
MLLALLLQGLFDLFSRVTTVKRSATTSDMRIMNRSLAAFICIGRDPTRERESRLKFACFVRELIDNTC